MSQLTNNRTCCLFYVFSVCLVQYVPLFCWSRFSITINNQHRIMHYTDVIMNPIASQITSLTIVCSTVYSDADQRKHQSSASLAFVWGIHRGPVNSPHKWPVMRKMFPFDDVIMDPEWALYPFITMHSICTGFCCVSIEMYDCSLLLKIR